MKWERHSMAYFILFIFSAHPDPSESLFKATEVTLGVSGAISVSGLGLALWILKRLKRKGESNSLLSFWTCSNSLIIYWKWIEMLNYVFLFPANNFDLNRWDVFFFFCSYIFLVSLLSLFITFGTYRTISAFVYFILVPWILRIHHSFIRTVLTVSYRRK